MKIRVNQTFGRRRLMADKKIQPGEYEADDSALFGLAEELVQHGYAEVLGGGELKAVPETKAPEDKKEMLMAELDSMAIAYKKSWGVARLRATLDTGLPQPSGPDHHVLEELPNDSDNL